ncbi:MAG: HpcH/HpaI aldolase/citrate lyase family protein [Acetoanaerobium sp.]|uniref:HpcH/HpaI aldolase/citrate lyase family protein n=1 Tax=Acetoanaerobium TaxID=186831 RepID=UPI001B3D0E9B|nr:HpcH/HpaI aldolase/citrate lyase family protein [Acetoanaerobium noterae]MBP9499754.1 HpcH/HpaI aldolase/citrate lyase family protein [Acetoanaerobium sp.]MBP9562051.1 HpcH/HpaI aldolase/citrate lyase family protein [Acetoanaerobium sp.]
MRHYMHLSDSELNKIFYKKPEAFDNTTKKNQLRYALGATLYLPATKYIAPYLLEKRYSHLTSFVMCFENLIEERNINIAEKTLLNTLRTLKMAENENRINKDELPLFFIHVRDPLQFERLYEILIKEKDIISYISGFFLPKFNSNNADAYLSTVKKIRLISEYIYALPIIESKEIISLASRISELITLEKTIFEYRDMILGIRIGGSYINSVLGVNSLEAMSIYDVGITASIIYDIINSFINLSYEDIAIYSSSWDKKITSFQTVSKSSNAFDQNKVIYNHAFTHDPSLDGFIREILLDKLNGCVGKTVVYPNQISIVNALYSVERKDYELALSINSSNEPSLNYGEQINNKIWSNKILSLSKIYGVLNENYSAVDLF